MRKISANSIERKIILFSSWGQMDRQEQPTLYQFEIFGHLGRCDMMGDARGYVVLGAIFHAKVDLYYLSQRS
jgi:hypothetical protein